MCTRLRVCVCVCVCSMSSTVSNKEEQQRHEEPTDADQVRLLKGKVAELEMANQSLRQALKTAELNHKREVRE